MATSHIKSHFTFNPVSQKEFYILHLFFLHFKMIPFFEILFHLKIGRVDLCLWIVTFGF